MLLYFTTTLLFAALEYHITQGRHTGLAAGYQKLSYPSSRGRLILFIIVFLFYYFLLLFLLQRYNIITVSTIRTTFSFR